MKLIPILIMILSAMPLLVSLVLSRRKRKKNDNGVEYLKLSRIELHSIRCRTCGQPLKHDDLIVWAEKQSGWKSAPSHAGCLVFIRHPDGSTTSLDGETELRTRSDGCVIDPLPVGAILLRGHEWKDWLKTVAVNLGSGDSTL